MKNNFKIILGLLLVSSFFACKKDLDINDNPNSPITATVGTVLPQAIVATAKNMSQFNSYGAQVVGYYANGGGVSGWGSIISYNYQTSEFGGLWSTPYDILTDVKFVLDQSEGDATLKEFNAAAKVLKAYNFELLVDTYNDVPYSEANLGLANLTPKYDKAEVIYKNLADLLDQAIATFKTVTTATPAFVAADPLYGLKTDASHTLANQIPNWIKFANTLKLKLVIKGQGKVAFTNTTFDAAGFITDDAMVQPGFAQVDGKQNPMYNSWAYAASGAAVSAASQYAPTPWILSFYDGTKLSDPARAAVVYKGGLDVPVNQLGYQLADAGRGASPSSWYIANAGVLKGAGAPQPIMLAAESYFLQAEANVKGIISTGTAADNFKSGMVASFNFLYKDATGAVPGTKNPSGDVETYIAANNDPANTETNYLVDFSLATTDAKKIEAIITQKYIAFNMTFGHEAWNEYRRTGYPTIKNAGADPDESFVSSVSESTAADRLPTRVLYPISEFKYNAANVPAADKYTSKIFWAK